jgi:hypothetical protein
MRTASEILVQAGIDLRSLRPGNSKILCPRCSHRRKKKRERCLSVEITDRGVRWCCHNGDCGWHGGAFYEHRDFGADGQKTFEDRGICLETVVRFGIYTARRASENGGVVPDENGNIIA